MRRPVETPSSIASLRHSLTLSPSLQDHGKTDYPCDNHEDYADYQGDDHESDDYQAGQLSNDHYWLYRQRCPIRWCQHCWV